MPGVRWPDGSPLLAGDIDPTSALTLDAAGAEQIDTIPSDAPLRTVPLGVAGDGRVVVSRMQSESIETEDADDIGFWDGDFARLGSTEKLVPVGPNRQTVGASDDGTTLVWTEISGTNIVASDWFVFAQPLDGSEGPRLLADAHGLWPEGASVDTGPMAPVLHDGRVYLHTPHPDAQSPTAFAVVSAPIAGGPLRVEAMDAFSPVATSGGVVVVRSDASVAADDEAHPLEKAVGIDLLTGDGSTRRLLDLDPAADGSPTVHQLLGAGDSLVLLTADAPVVVDLAARTAVRLPAPAATAPGPTVACADRVVWTTSADSLIFDTTSGRLVRHPSPAAELLPMCGGDLVLWDDDEPAASWAVLRVPR